MLAVRRRVYFQPYNWIGFVVWNASADMICIASV